MKHVALSSTAFGYPMPTAVIGTVENGSPSYLTIAWLTRVSMSPARMAVTMNKNHKSTATLRETREFSINIPGVDLLEKVDAVGMASGRHADKSGVFTAFYGQLAGAPLIRECPVAMECRLVEEVSLSSHFIFVGEIVGFWAREDAVTDGHVDLTKTKPFLLSMLDNRYFAVGEPIAKAWSAGKALAGSLPRR
jgi:flavin reductase (DIM6/NTAB) family NADH-FMN oxidoreductase RutF